MKLSISLAFDGRCEAAFRFYERCFGGTLTMMMTWGESPMAADAPVEWRGKVFHATLAIADAVLYGGDPLPGSYQRPQGFHIQLDLNDPARAEAMYAALSDGGVVTMPLQTTFWAARVGSVVDRFGVTWTINCEGAEAAR
jgi:PhnB protein